MSVVNEKSKEIKADTKIRHVTKPGANLFLELGFAPADASACKQHRASISMTPSC